MRIAPIVYVVACVSACGGNRAAPSSVSGGITTNIAGTWDGTIISSNNATQQFGMILTQSGSDVSGSWTSTSVGWDGQISGAVSGSSFTGQVKFSGMALNGTVCAGTANVTGPASVPTMSWTSVSGVVGGGCPAPLPVGLKIDVQRQ